ncbi:hypothetical protein PT2222_120269 [Paraburkholderia tropica]
MLAQSNKSRQLFEMMATLYTGGFHEESPIIFVSTLSLYMKQTILNAFYFCHHVVMY